MKKSTILFCLTLACNVAFGQDFSKLANYEFKTADDYSPAEKQVLACANYLFENPANEEELNRLYAVQYIMKWMTGTPDYTFQIGNEAMSLTKGNTDLLGLYMAAMSKVVLENEGEKLTDKEVYNRSERLMVDYCGNAANKMKPSKKIKGILKERSK